MPEVSVERDRVLEPFIGFMACRVKKHRAEPIPCDEQPLVRI